LSQVITTPPRILHEHAAAVILQKVIRGFLLRKHLKALWKINMTVEKLDKQVAKYEENLESDKMTNFSIEDNLIMNLLSEMNSISVSMVYKRNIIQKMMSLQKRVNTVSAKAHKLDLDTLLEKSGMVANSDDFVSESFIFSRMKHSKVQEKRCSIEEALSDSTYSTRMQEKKNTMTNIVWDPLEDDEFYIEMNFYAPNAQNPGNSRIEENKRVEAANLVEQPEMQKLSEAMVESDKLTKQPSNFNQNDEVNLTEKPSPECMRLTKTPEMEERKKTTNVDENFIEKELESNDSDMKTTDEVYDSINNETLLDICQKLKSHNEFGDHALELFQLKTYYNQTEELKEELKDLSTQSKEIKASIKELENMVVELGMTFQRIERIDKTNMKFFGRRCESFS
jgi:IQ calmodulin-binding motif